MIAALLALVVGIPFVLGWADALEPLVVAPAALARRAGTAAAIAAVGTTIAGRRLEFLNTLAHEMSHAAATLLTGGSVKRLEASDGEGGMVRRRGGWGAFVAIAPYSVPWSALVVAALDGVYRNGECGPAAALAVGGLFGWHMITAIDDMRRNFQPGTGPGNDTRVLGKVPTLLWVALLNFAFAGLLLAFVSGGISEVGELLRHFAEAEREMLGALRDAVIAR